VSDNPRQHRLQYLVAIAIDNRLLAFFTQFACSGADAHFQRRSTDIKCGNAHPVSSS